jgi:hypothetical protein
MMTKFCMAMVLTGFVLACVDPAIGADPEEGKYYRIKNVRSEKVLTVSDKGKEEGAKIEQVLQAPSLLQQWEFVKVGGYYKIVNRKTGKALNVQSESQEEDAPIIQWDANVDNENLQWSLLKVGDNFKFKARHSGMVMQVKDSGESTVVQFPIRKDNKNQVFELVPIRDKK